MKRLMKKAEVNEKEKQEILEAVFGEETTLIDDFHNSIDEIFDNKEEEY